MRWAAFLIPFLAVACGRGGAGPAAVSLSGRLTVLGAAPLVAAEPAACVPGELVALPAPGLDARTLARRAGLVCLREAPDSCLLRCSDADVRAACDRLEADGLAAWAEPNYLRRLAARPDDALYAEQWALRQIRADAAWEHTTGSEGVVVGVIDSGIRSAHPDLQGRVLPGWDFVDGDPDPEDPTPGLAHGTQTAGIIAAASHNGIGISGVLWDGRILPVRVFGTAGVASTFDIAQGIRFAAGLANDSGQVPAVPAQVLNLSFASPTPAFVEESACSAARAAGVLSVAAAGNDGTTAPRYPAAYDSVLAVAATGPDGRAASYSGFGSWIDLAAPGGSAAAPIRVAGIDGSGAFAYPFVSGTSFAAPHATGVAALALGLAPHTPDELEALLKGTATDIGVPGADERTGAGLVDAYRTVITVLGLEAPPVVPEERVTVRLLRSPGLEPVLSVETDEARSLAWGLADVEPGTYVLEAGTDRNWNGVLDEPGETYGRYAGTLTVAPGASRTDLDFAIAPR